MASISRHSCQREIAVLQLLSYFSARYKSLLLLPWEFSGSWKKWTRAPAFSRDEILLSVGVLWVMTLCVNSLEPACSAAGHGRGALGIYLACESPGLHMSKDMLQPKSWPTSLSWEPGVHKWDLVLYGAFSVMCGGKQTTLKVSAACLRFKSPNCKKLHWWCEMMRLQP